MRTIWALFKRAMFLQARMSCACCSQRLSDIAAPIRLHGAIRLQFGSARESVIRGKLLGKSPTSLLASCVSSDLSVGAWLHAPTDEGGATDALAQGGF